MLKPFDERLLALLLCGLCPRSTSGIGSKGKDTKLRTLLLFKHEKTD